MALYDSLQHVILEMVYLFCGAKNIVYKQVCERHLKPGLVAVGDSWEHSPQLNKVRKLLESRTSGIVSGHCAKSDRMSSFCAFSKEEKDRVSGWTRLPHSQSWQQKLCLLEDQKRRDRHKGCARRLVNKWCHMKQRCKKCKKKAQSMHLSNSKSTTRVSCFMLVTQLRKEAQFFVVTLPLFTWRMQWARFLWELEVSKLRNNLADCVWGVAFRPSQSFLILRVQLRADVTPGGEQLQAWLDSKASQK